MYTYQYAVKVKNILDKTLEIYGWETYIKLWNTYQDIIPYEDYNIEETFENMATYHLLMNTLYEF